MYEQSLRKAAKLLSSKRKSELLNSIGQAEQYLKVRYKTHCANDDNCFCHCINHGLPHTKDRDFQSDCDVIHDRVCPQCLNLTECMDTIKRELCQLPTSH